MSTITAHEVVSKSELSEPYCCYGNFHKSIISIRHNFLWPEYVPFLGIYILDPQQYIEFYMGFGRKIFINLLVLSIAYSMMAQLK